MTAGVSEISICNYALALVGEQPIVSFAGNTEAERQCAALYGLSRDALLREHPWNFATKQTILSANADAPLFEFNQSYNLPPDCIRCLRLYANDAPFRVFAGGVLETDATPVNLVYTAQVTDTSKYDPMFVQALSYYLAAQLALILSNKASLHTQLMSLFDMIMKKARQSDGQEGTPYKLGFVDDWRKFRWINWPGRVT